MTLGVWVDDVRYLPQGGSRRPGALKGGTFVQPLDIGSHVGLVGDVNIGGRLPARAWKTWCGASRPDLPHSAADSRLSLGGALYALFDGLFQWCLLRHLSGDRNAIADLQEEVERLLPTVA